MKTQNTQAVSVKTARIHALFMAQAAMIAALYIVLTFIANAFGLANYAVQVRFSEALTVLPYFTPAAIPGLFIGCLLSNILTGCALPDIVFGSLATLLGALGTYMCHAEMEMVRACLPDSREYGYCAAYTGLRLRTSDRGHVTDTVSRLLLPDRGGGGSNLLRDSGDDTAYGAAKIRQSYFCQLI